MPVRTISSSLINYNELSFSRMCFELICLSQVTTSVFFSFSF